MAHLALRLVGRFACRLREAHDARERKQHCGRHVDSNLACHFLVPQGFPRLAYSRTIADENYFFNNSRVASFAPNQKIAATFNVKKTKKGGLDSLCFQP